MTTTLVEPRTHPDDPGEPQHGRPRVGIAPDEEVILSALAYGRNCLDIGTGLGYAARALRAGTEFAVWSIDPDPWVEDIIAPGLERGLDEMDECIACLREWPIRSLGWYWDLVFIDADHTPAAVEADVISALCRTRPGGLIVLHDWTLASVREGTRRATDLPVYEIATTYGLGLIVVPDREDADA